MTSACTLLYRKFYNDKALKFPDFLYPTMSHHQHDTPKKNRLVGAYKATKSVAEAACIEDLPYATAWKIIHKYKSTGSTANQQRSGWPTSITERTERQIIREVVSNRCKPLQDIANDLSLGVSKHTIRRVLARAGFHRRVARKVPYLTQKHRQVRLAWAKRLKRWNQQMFSHIIFSDECYIHLGDRKGRVFVTRRPDEVLLEDCLVPTFKQSPIRVMVWGCIMDGKKGPLVVLEYPGGKGGGMTSARYQEQVLDRVLIPFHTKVSRERGCAFFQQDNASSHMSKSTRNWFRSHQIPIFSHPASSPNMNPIEGVWHELKHIIRASPNPPTSLHSLKTAIHAAWDELSIETVNKYVGTMEQRIQAIIHVRGGHTCY